MGSLWTKRPPITPNFLRSTSWAAPGQTTRVFDVFGLPLQEADLQRVGEIAAAAYPNEACGLGFGASTGGVRRWVSITNQAPWPRAHFELDPLEHIAAVDSAAQQGWGTRVLFHSHCDSAPVLSAADQAGAVWRGVELIPEVIYLIVSLRAGRPRAWAVHRYLPGSTRFETRHGPQAW